MRQALRRMMAVVLAFVVGMTSVGVYQGKEEKVVRVGFYHMSGFQYYDDYAVPQGYCMEYLDTLASVTGWKYEYVAVEDFRDGCAKLEEHTIDLIAPAMLTEERREVYDYSELSFGTEYTVLVTKQEREDLFYEDFEAFGRLKIAVLRDYPLTQYFLTYQNIHGFSPELVYFDTIDESKSAMESGEVDAIVTSIMDMESGQKLLARFSPQPFYFLTWKGNTQFLEELNLAMAQVQNTYPTLLDQLLVTHYPIYRLQFYSREEMEFVSGLGTLRVAYVADRRPLSFMNEKGEFAGISREIFDKIAQSCGLKFEYVALPSRSITYKYLQDQKIDLVAGVEDNSTNRNAKGMLLSSPYLSSRKMIVSRKNLQYDTDGAYKIAVPVGSQTLRTVLSAQYPNMEITEYKTNMECFEALQNHEADMLIQNQYVVEAVLSKPRYSDFVVAPMEGMADELCFSPVLNINDGYGMSETDAIRLVTVLNKAISKLESQEVENIIVRETLQNQYALDFMDFVYGYGWVISSLTVAFIFLLLFVITLVMTRRVEEKRKIKENRLKELEQKRYKTIMECSDDMIYEISLDGTSNICSDKIKKKFGWEIPNKVEHLDFSKTMKILHVHPEDEQAFKANLLMQGEGVSDELLVRMEKADGNYIWCKVFRTPLIDENHNLVSILGKIEDVDEEIRERKALEASSRTDDLTGLLKKSTFKFEVKDYLANNSAKGAGFVFADMDHFKEINDKLGHSTGDTVIKECAKKIQLLFANFDLVSRFGGDEFCVFVKEIPKETLEERLQFAVEKLRADYPYDEGVIHLSASIGAAYCSKDKVDYRTLLETADAALYKVKDAGRNNFRLEEIQ